MIRLALPLIALSLGASPLAGPATAQEPPEILIDAPSIALSGVPLSLTLRVPEEGVPVDFLLRTAGGDDLASGRLEPGEERTIGGLRLAGGGDLPLQLEYAATSQAIDMRWLPGWVSLLPPLVAILLAMLIREVVISLFLGVWLGAFFFAGRFSLRIRTPPLVSSRSTGSGLVAGSVMLASEVAARRSDHDATGPWAARSRLPVSSAISSNPSG